MSQLTTPTEQRCLPVRLDRIRPEVLTAAARYIAHREPADAAECLYAALHPSDTVYYVAIEAAPVLKRIADPEAPMPLADDEPLPWWLKAAA